METWRAHCAEVLGRLHDRREAKVNRRRMDPKPLAVGDKVWYAPDAERNDLDSKWQGPCLVVDRHSDHSYVVQVAPNRTVEAHRS